MPNNQIAFEFFSIAFNEIIDASSSNSPSLLKLYNINKEIGTISLADMHLKGLGVDKDMKKAYQIYSKLANEGSFIIALTEVADFYRYGLCVEKNKEKVFELYLKSAEKGIFTAQNRVGWCCIDGIGTPKDVTQGYSWYMKAALAGNIYSIFNAGFCYTNGIGVDIDYQKAIKWLSKAAEKGDVAAQYSLGKFYEANTDHVQSFEWYKKAAEGNDIYGLYEVGKFFYEGCGTERDIVNAIYWLNKAKENGNINSNKLLGKIINKIK
ncbi:hypothetical protein Glove_365g220 [Diversispora epigaea]|uniref:Uncharacterized protein n=1 Tax=Diversispora epigaea TaxID=1348612 RepID=A0A397H7N5_9GLOM|nr:hypothetical protein Glove_365g220 [Diversispora epigaea]